MTAFYSWRLMFMTFHGKPRADQHDVIDARPREPPPVMLVPLLVLAVGAVLAGVVFARTSSATARREFWSGAFDGADNHVAAGACTRCPIWVVLAPTVAMAARASLLAWYFYIADPLAAARPRRALPAGSTCSCSTSGTSTSSTTSLFVQPAMRLGRFLWKTGDGAIIDGLGPTASPRGVHRRHASAWCGCRPATSITTPSPC